jgi:acetyl-CoA carboxylase carboxyltransferase component
LQIQVSGKNVSDEEQQKLLNEITSRYEKQTSPYYAAARLWVDDIIDPAQTRTVISEGLAAANHNAEIKDLKLGVFQV